MVKTFEEEFSIFKPTPEGLEYASKGLPERRLLEALEAKPGSLLKVKAEGRKAFTVKLVKSYSEVEVGSLLALIGSWGTLELSANQDSASKILKLKAGQTLSVERQR